MTTIVINHIIVGVVLIQTYCCQSTNIECCSLFNIKTMSVERPVLTVKMALLMKLLLNSPLLGTLLASLVNVEAVVFARYFSAPERKTRVITIAEQVGTMKTL